MTGYLTHLLNLFWYYIEKSIEIFSESSEVSKNNAFLKFGLADTAIIDTAKSSYTKSEQVMRII